MEIFDYFVFSVMLIISTFIGIYFAYFARQKQDTTSEYLMGGRSMGVLPISMSLIASYISGISILGLPAEMYVYGTQYWMIILPEALVGLAIAFIYLPVFYELRITSSYEYLNQRFGRSVELLGIFIFLLRMVFYIPIVIYVPALALSQVTQINLHLITPVVCAICIFYTTVGGIKAVVWTDTLQMLIMLLGSVTVLILGLKNAGGFYKVIERAEQSNRLEFFNTEFSPTIRHTFWSVSVGNFFYWLSSSSDQAMVQRLLAMSSVRKGYVALIMLTLGIVVLVSINCFTGLVIYANYYLCDPIKNGVIRKSDQLLPLFVKEVSKNVPGLLGIFLSGVFSAALSTMSTGLNSMSGVIFEALIRPMFRENVSENLASFIMKILVVAIGAACVALVFVVEQLGTLIQAGKSLTGITAGPLLGIFTLGIFFPCTSEKGAFLGGLSSLLIMTWISIGSQNEIAKGNIVFPTKSLSIEGCPNIVENSTLITITSFLNDSSTFVPSCARVEPPYLYQISYMWYSSIGLMITLIIGLFMSYVSGFNDPKTVHKELFAPLIRRFFFPNKVNELKENHIYLAKITHEEK